METDETHISAIGYAIENDEPEEAEKALLAIAQRRAKTPHEEVARRWQTLVDKLQSE